MAAAAIIGGIGLASSIGGQIAAGVSRSNQAQQQQEAIDEAAAQDVVTTEFEIAKTREEGKRVQSAQTAGYGKAGVVLEGSPLRQLVETTQRTEEDVFWQQQKLKDRIKMMKLQGASTESARQAGVIQSGFGVGGTLLSGLARLPGVF